MLALALRNWCRTAEAKVILGEVIATLTPAMCSPMPNCGGSILLMSDSRPYARVWVMIRRSSSSWRVIMLPQR
jgi:hypothetical protein